MGALLVLTAVLNKPVYDSLSDDRDILGFRDQMLPLVILVLGLDLWQVIIGATLRALQLQTVTCGIFVISYYLILTPLSIAFAFHIGSRIDVDNKETYGEEVQGMGLIGQWLSMVITLVF